MSSSVAEDAGSARPGPRFSTIAVIFTTIYVVHATLSTSSNVVAACYSTWAILCLARLVSGDKTAISDGLVFIILLLPSNIPLVRIIFEACSTYTSSTLPIISSATLIAALVISGVFHKSRTLGELNNTEADDSEKHLKPLLFPCRTTHTRIFPKNHSFAYSYLLVGIPIGPKQYHGRYGSMLSVDNSLEQWPAKRKGWFHVQGSDYLERGNENLDLKAKLTQYLESQGVSGHEWHHAYLVTAPRFLGYSFNPVSFWYIYSNQHELLMMVLEVNNTFDERRMYLLKASSAKDSDKSDIQSNHEGPDRTPKFINAWPKDFHVSPFNSRQGSYSLAAVDPFGKSQEHCPRIDNNIVLRSSENHPKLVARIFSEGRPRDPSTLSALEALCFIASWWWVGLITFPRILKEAYKLYFRRNLQVFFRPEVVPTSIGRHSTLVERDLESFFRRYLGYVVANTTESVRVAYTPAPGLGETREFLSAGVQNGRANNSLEIQVTSPAFYSRFMHYSHTSEALDRECLFTDEKNRTVWILNPQNLNLLSLQNKRDMSPVAGPVNFADATGWRVLRALRCSPPAPSYPNDENYHDPAFVSEDIRQKNFSACDEYVMQNCPDAWLYRKALLKLFLAQRFGLGFTEFIDLLDLTLRACLILGVLLLVPRDLQNLPQGGAKGAMAMASAIIKTLGFNIAHIWSLIKGAL